MDIKLYQEAESLINDVYWNETHDRSCKLNIEGIIHERLVKDNQEKDPEYYAHREGVVHVTSLSKCLRGVAFEMLGAKKDSPPDARQLGIFRAGNLFEDFIVDSLGSLMLDRQTEYVFKYKNIILTGRDDGTLSHDGQRRILEVKSVHSDSFWHREREGTLIATHNQMQIQTYLWLRRECKNVFFDGDSRDGSIVYSNMEGQEVEEFLGRRVVSSVHPDNSQLGGIFAYVSKDDCTIKTAAVKFNQRIIDATIIPALDIIAEAYEKKDATLAPTPSLAMYSDSKNQWQKNWLAKYCDYHTQCAGTGWVMEAETLVSQKNKELKLSMASFAHTEKKEKPKIEVVGAVEPTPSTNNN